MFHVFVRIPSGDLFAEWVENASKWHFKTHSIRKIVTDPVGYPFICSFGFAVQAMAEKFQTWANLQDNCHVTPVCWVPDPSGFLRAPTKTARSKTR